MNRISLLSVTAIVALTLTACSKQSTTDKPAAKTPEAASTDKPAGPTAPANTTGFTSLDQKFSYGVGYDIGTRLDQTKAVTIDQEAVRAGLADALSGTKTRIPEAELQAAFAAIQQKVTAAAAAAGEKQKVAGAEFLAKNKTRPGVKVTASGLQYEVLTSGIGAKPKSTDTVKVHYHGTLIDGTVFDSSVDRGQPVEFPVTGVIQGWIEALQLMSVGDKWKLYIPAELAYGANPRPKIPANSVLIFEVQLLGIK